MYAHDDVSCYGEVGTDTPQPYIRTIFQMNDFFKSYFGPYIINEVMNHQMQPVACHVNSSVNVALIYNL